jgi:hypothetical protein
MALTEAVFSILDRVEKMMLEETVVQKYQICWKPIPPNETAIQVHFLCKNKASQVVVVDEVMQCLMAVASQAKIDLQEPWNHWPKVGNLHRRRMCSCGSAPKYGGEGLEVLQAAHRKLVSLVHRYLKKGKQNDRYRIH